ncbi:MAG TPA: methyltransferase domain-containing protein [Herpetosiphonaceae bacterium]
MPPQDIFSMTDHLDQQMLDVMVTRLEARGRHPFFSTMLQEYLEAMAIDSARTVLDLGCGTGLAARTIALRARFVGTIVGIDLSAYLLDAATRLAAEAGVASRVTFQVGDTHHLDLPDAQFDAVVAHTLLSHVTDPGAVVQEAARLVRPGGMVGIFDGDYASLTFDQEDLVQGRADDEALITALVANPRVMRQMPRLLRRAGLTIIACFPYVLAEVGQADFWASGIEAYRRLVPRSGTMTEAQADAWAGRLAHDSDVGQFFGASNFYAYVARKATPPAHAGPTPTAEHA